MKIETYTFEITEFQPSLQRKHKVCTLLSEALLELSDLPERDAVIVVIALGEGVDWGNFYIFLNSQGYAHIMLHEERELFPVDPLFALESLEVEFQDENGTRFSVKAKLTTSTERAKLALEHWLPEVKRWNELKWE